jgi:TetR/AcrR family transcriptional regulator, transcriptional repressor for nem operon
MRYPKNHKQEMREHLLSQTGSHAKAQGFSASGVDALAGAAGLTTGSLYKHFDNKDALFTALVTTELAQTTQRFDGITPGDTEAVQKALNSYLSMSHVRDAASGCPVPSLAAEVARASEDVRRSFEVGIVDLKNAMAALTGSDAAAWTLMAQNVGAVLIARAMRSDAARREILAAVRLAGAELVKSDTKPNLT